MSEQNTGCTPDLNPCDYSFPAMYQASTVGDEIRAHLENLACDSNDGSYCGLLDMCEAEGELLTLIGQRVGWPREHCSVKPVEFFGLNCVTPPPVGTGCPQANVVGLCNGAFFFCRLDGRENFRFDDDELYRSFVKAAAIKQRARRFKEQSSVKLIEEIITQLWGEDAWVVSADNGVIQVTAGRDLTNEEICILSLYEQVICTGVGIRLEIFCVAPQRVNCSAPIIPDAAPFIDMCEEGDAVNITHGTFVQRDGTFPPLSQTGLAANLTFTDNGNGTYTITGMCDASGSSPYVITAGAGGNSVTVLGSVITQNVAGVNNPPIANGIQPNNQTITNGSSIAPMNFASCFTDPDGDVLTYALTPPVAGLAVNQLTGFVTGSPSGISAPFPASVTVTVEANDGNGGTATCDGIITVNEFIAPPTLSGNDCPVFPTALENQTSDQPAEDGGQTQFFPFNGTGTISVSGIPNSFVTQVGNGYSIIVPANTPAGGALTYSVTLTNTSGSATCTGNLFEIIGL